MLIGYHRIATKPLAGGNAQHTVVVRSRAGGPLGVQVLVRVLLRVLALSLAAGSGHATHSVLPQRFNCDQLALHKSHKTGSSSLAASLFRVGLASHRRCARALPNAENRTRRFNRDTKENHYFRQPWQLQKEPADFSVNHARASFKDMVPYYQNISYHPGFITILREPLSRFVSDFDYFDKTEHPYAQLMNHKPVNRMAKELGYNTYESLWQFIQSEAFQDMVLLIVESFEEGMAALHLHCGWDIKHLVSIPSNCASCGHPLRRYDGRLVPPHPHLSPQQSQQILEMNSLDSALYLHAREKWYSIQGRADKLLMDAVAELRRQEAVLESYCHDRVYRDRSSEQGDWQPYPACIWLTLEDLEYEKIIGEDGWPQMDTPLKLLPSHGGDMNQDSDITMQMALDDFERVYEELIGEPKHVG